MKHVKLTLLLCLFTGTSYAADWTANIGWASDYYFRGILQKSSSASGGIDFAHEGFYAGVWAADVGELTGNGLEVDGYFGYNGSIGDVSYGAGFTGYYYTGDFDDTYQEVNLSAGWKFVSFDVALGKYNNFGLADQNYQYYSVTLQHNGFYGKYATFEHDFDGAYFEAGYGTSIADFDVGFYALYSDENLVGEATEALVFTIGKTFNLN